jgi:hypothetical protein
MKIDATDAAAIPRMIAIYGGKGAEEWLVIVNLKKDSLWKITNKGHISCFSIDSWMFDTNGLFVLGQLTNSFIKIKPHFPQHESFKQREYLQHVCI